ncbi:MAG TPA: ABC transporter ATP-binding protein [Usitatibacter sp.]|nr:ABC transporter ATP-binding protein [Usitatibacter sp.]
MAHEAAGTAALRLSGVDAFYGDSHVLHGVSFSLVPGRVLALLGRNGAGKTTCMNAVMGMLRTCSGDIRLFDEAILGLAPDAIARRGVGLVPQGRRIFQSLTVFENLSVAVRKARCGPERSLGIEDVFTRFPQLAQRRRQVAGSLSGGEQQMLAIGRALVSNPRVLLMDEPSEGLAPIIVHQVAEALLSLKEAGFSILLVEQNATLALGIADEVAILNTGRVVYEGSAGQARGERELLNSHLGII